MTEPASNPEPPAAEPAPVAQPAPVTQPAPPARKLVVRQWVRSHPLQLVAVLLVGLVLGCCLGGVVGIVAAHHMREFDRHSRMGDHRGDPRRPDIRRPGAPGFGDRQLPAPTATASPKAS